MEDKGRFLDSDDPTLPTEFKALGREGSSLYMGLETFDNPGCAVVMYRSDEVVAKCPVTGQPDYYTCEITLRGSPKLIESKSLKLFFNNLHESTMAGAPGLFCETLAVYLRDMVAEAVGSEAEDVGILLIQKSRGGITIRALA